MINVSNKNLLIEAIENLSEEEIAMLLKMVTGLLDFNYKIEKVPEDYPDLPGYIKILEEMNAGEYVVLS